MDRSRVNESQDDFFERYQYIRLGGRVNTTAKFRFQLNNACKAGRLDLVVFVQDRNTGLVYQTMVLPWVQGDSRTGSEAIGKGATRVKRPALDRPAGAIEVAACLDLWSRDRLTGEDRSWGRVRLPL